MVRPRTLSRSTKVVAEGHEHKRRKGNKKKNGPSKKAVKWDHDDTSSSDGEPKSTATKASAGKKRPRQDGAGVEVVSRGAVVKEKEVLERRPGADGEVDSEGGRDLVPAQGGSGEEDEGEADDLEVVRGNQTAAAASKGGMGDVMAKIMGQQLGSKTQVCTFTPTAERLTTELHPTNLCTRKGIQSFMTLKKKMNLSKRLQ